VLHEISQLKPHLITMKAIYRSKWWQSLGGLDLNFINNLEIIKGPHQTTYCGV
jgi:hypothetical protein